MYKFRKYITTNINKITKDDDSRDYIDSTVIDSFEENYKEKVIYLENIRNKYFVVVKVFVKTNTSCGWNKWELILLHL